MRSRTIPFLNEQRHSCVNLSAEGRLHLKVPPEEYFDSFTENAFTAEIKDKNASRDNGPIFPLKATLQPNVSQVFLLSLKEEMVGYPFVRIKVPVGTPVELVFGEGDLPGSLLPYHCWPGNLVQLTTADGITEFESFDWEAVKELAVLVRGSGTAEILDAGVTRITVPFPRKPDFRCSDDTINRSMTQASTPPSTSPTNACATILPGSRQQYAGEVGSNLLSHYLAFGEYRMASALPVDMGRWAER